MTHLEPIDTDDTGDLIPPLLWYIRGPEQKFSWLSETHLRISGLDSTFFKVEGTSSLVQIVEGSTIVGGRIKNKGFIIGKNKYHKQRKTNTIWNPVDR